MNSSAGWRGVSELDPGFKYAQSMMFKVFAVLIVTSVSVYHYTIWIYYLTRLTPGSRRPPGKWLEETLAKDLKGTSKN